MFQKSQTWRQNQAFERGCNQSYEENVERYDQFTLGIYSTEVVHKTRRQDEAGR